MEAIVRAATTLDLDLITNSGLIESLESTAQLCMKTLYGDWSQNGRRKLSIVNTLFVCFSVHVYEEDYLSIIYSLSLSSKRRGFTTALKWGWYS